MCYVNQAQVDKIKKEVREMLPNAPLGVSSRNNVALEVSVELKIEGNGKIINKLEAMGFHKGKKRMLQRSDIWNKQETCAYVIVMWKAV